MSDFVDECTKEWQRRGVPTAAANEMATELAADLAEAAGDGVSAEEVLGNAVFDPRSFAADWASERGLVKPEPTGRSGSWLRGAVLIAVAGGSVLLALVGLALAVRVHTATGIVPSERLVRPKLLLPPDVGSTRGPETVARFVGLAFVAVGLIGLVMSLVVWKPWKTARLRHIGS